jgi:hypothetical protein
VGRFAPKYDKAQTNAVVAAIVEDGLSAAKACQLAKDGQLGTLGRFEYNVATARHYAAVEKRKRKGKQMREIRKQGEPETRLDALLATMLDSLEIETDRIHRAAKSRQGLTMRDAQIAREVTKAARECRGLARGIPITGSSKKTAELAKAAQRPGETPPGEPADPDAGLSPEAIAALAELDAEQNGQPTSQHLAARRP